MTTRKEPTRGQLIACGSVTLALGLGEFGLMAWSWQHGGNPPWLTLCSGARC
jgi:hypothetical protein